MDGIRYWIETEGTGHWFFIAFPVVLLCLFSWFKGRRAHFLIPSLLISLVVINPWFYKKWNELGLYAYWRILWVIPVIPIVAALIPSLTEKTNRIKDRLWIKRALKAVIVAAGIVCVILGGTFIYSGNGGQFAEAANASKIPDYVVTLADRLLELDDHPRIIAQDPVGIYIRQYTGKIDTLYGRDLYGYIYSAGGMARNVSSIVNNQDADMSSVSQLMLDDGFGYLVMTERSTYDSLELIDVVEGYGIYRAKGEPKVVKERNELGQVIAVTTIDENGDSRNSEQGYSTVLYEYDDNGQVYKEFRIDADGNGVTDKKGIAGYKWQYDSQFRMIREDYLGIDGQLTNRYDLMYATKLINRDKDRIIGETYYNPQGNPVKTTAGYASWHYEHEGPVENIVFVDEKGNKVPFDNINLASGIRYDDDGWTEWITPTRNVENYYRCIGNANLGERVAGDIYTCQLEIEFKDVEATEGKPFFFRTQGSVDKRWTVGNVWNNIAYLHDIPANGVYTYIGSVTIDSLMAEANNFDIEFRCDYWANGSFRVRRVKIEKGKIATEWTPGL